MFEKATLINPTVGRLAEAMLFYGKVELIADTTTISELIQNPSFDYLFSLIDSGQLEIFFSPKTLGVRNLGLELDPISIERVTARKKDLSPTQHLISSLTRQLGDDKDIRRIAIKIGKLVKKPPKFRPIAGEEQNPFLDPEITTSLALGYLKEMSPTLRLPSNKYFRLVRGQSKYLLDTNLEIAKLGLKDHSGTLIDDNRVFLAIHTAARDLAASITYKGDFFCPSLSSQFIQRYKEKQSGAPSSKREDIEIFSEIVLPNRRSVRMAIDSGDRSFSEFLGLYDQASKFKEWVLSEDDSATLAKEYFEAISKTSWYDSPIATTARLVLPFAAGLLFPPAGLVASAADFGLAKKMQPGRLPRLYVEGPLSEFVDINGKQRWPLIGN